MTDIRTEKTLAGYRLNFNGQNLAADIGHLNVHSDGRLTGSVCLILGKKGQQEPTFTFNFTSDATRKRLINTLTEKYPDWTWLPIIDELCRTVQNLSKAGEDDCLIQPYSPEGKHPGYYIEPVVMKGVPNVIYGDKGVNKTTLALTMLGVVVNQVADSTSGLIATERANVALLDWENSSGLTDYTTSRLVEGETIPYFELPYLRCNLPLADDIERIGRFLYKYEVKLLMIDSLGKAAGSDSRDSSGKNAALRFFECLDRFEIPGLTTIIIGQNAKDDSNRKSIFGSSFYTYYSRNIFRLEAGKQKDLDSDEMRVALIHEEGNFSGKYRPIGFRLNYTEESISINREEAQLSEYMERVSQTKDLYDFLRSGRKTVKQIAGELEISDNRARVLLSKLKGRGKIVSLGPGVYGLASEQAEQGF